MSPVHTVHRFAWVVLLGIAAGPLPGCALFGGPESDFGELPSDASDVVQASYHEALADPDLSPKPLGLKDFSPDRIGATTWRLMGKGPDKNAALRSYQDAEELYQQAVAHHNARQSADDLFRQASAQYTTAARRWPDSSIEQDALFRAAECEFFANRYVQADEYLEQLLKKYPNTRYLDMVEARRFLIAQYWLQLAKAGTSSVLGFNLTDNGRPLTDTFGNGVKILDRMRIEDPTGKLADDATIAAGNAFLETGDYSRADQYYSDLRTNFPNSEHQFMAHFLGIESKLKGYKGPNYAGGVLDEAEKLIKQVRRQFPQEARKHQDTIDRAMSEVRYRKAEREWVMAKYYLQRNEYGAARFYCQVVATNFPDTPFADKSRTELARLAGKPVRPAQKLGWLVDLFPTDDESKPLLATPPDSTLRR